MRTDLPIACSLDATELAERLAWMGELGGSALADVRQDGSEPSFDLRGVPVFAKSWRGS